MCLENNVITRSSLRQDPYCHEVTESIFKNRKKVHPEDTELKTRRGTGSMRGRGKQQEAVI